MALNLTVEGMSYPQAQTTAAEVRCIAAFGQKLHSIHLKAMELGQFLVEDMSHLGFGSPG